MSLKNRFCNVEIAFISRVSIAVLRHNVRNFHGERLSNSISSHSVFLMRHNIQNWYSKWPLKFDFPIPMRLKFRFFHRQYFIWMFRFLNVFVNSLSRTDLQRHSWKLVLSSSFRNIAPSSNRFESAGTCRMHNWAIMRYSIRSFRLQACFSATKRTEKNIGKKKLKFSNAKLQNWRGRFIFSFIFDTGVFFRCERGQETYFFFFRPYVPDCMGSR